MPDILDRINVHIEEILAAGGDPDELKFYKDIAPNLSEKEQEEMLNILKEEAGLLKEKK